MPNSIKFQSAPRSRDRGDPLALSNQPPCVVSIRAPVSRPGRPARVQPAVIRSGFQSAPRSRDRGDSSCNASGSPYQSFNPRPGLATGATSRMSESIASRHARFQSAPRSRDRGDSFDFCSFGFGDGVSIRAPVSRPGRLLPESSNCTRSDCFNPRPGLATGATSSHRMIATTEACFNPRPGLATGATRWPCADSPA